jgi:DNA topoisomerase III
MVSIAISLSCQLLTDVGSCQFPTLGFVVDRYFRVKNFKPEPFWSIRIVHKKDGLSATFSWARNHLFDRMAVVIMYERCLMAKTAKVTKMQKRPTSKWRPLPLTTVELQKLGSKYLRMNSSQVMKVILTQPMPKKDIH